MCWRFASQLQWPGPRLKPRLDQVHLHPGEREAFRQRSCSFRQASPGELGHEQHIASFQADIDALARDSQHGSRVCMTDCRGVAVEALRALDRSAPEVDPLWLPSEARKHWRRTSSSSSTMASHKTAACQCLVHRHALPFQTWGRC